MLRLGARVVAGGHGKPVSKKVGKPEDKKSRNRQVCTYHARYNRERCDRAVDATVDPIPEVTAPRAMGQAIVDRLLGVTMFKRK